MTTTDDLTKRIARILNGEGWTFEGVHEPGDYDECEDCRRVVDPIAARITGEITTEVRAAKAGAILMDGFDMAVADRLADAGYTEYAEDEDGGVTWVSAPLGEVLHIVRICATEYETGDADEHR